MKTFLRLMVPTNRELGEAIELIRRSFHTRLALVLLLVDLGFVLLHLAVVADLIGGGAGPYRIDEDGSVAEWYGYGKMALAALLLLLASARGRHFLFPMSLIMTFLLIDDAFSVHEAVGELLNPDHVNRGEALFMTVAGSFCMILAVASCRFSDRQTRVQILFVLGTVLALGVFAVVADAAHVLAPYHSQTADLVAGVVEDGGELVCMSALLLVCRALWRRAAPAFPYAPAGRWV